MVDIRAGILIVKELAVGSVDNSNTSFGTTHKYVALTLSVFINGQKLVKDDDYFETTDQSFSMVNPPLNDLGYTDKITVEYEQK